MVEDDFCIVIEDVWKDRIVNPIDSFFERLNKTEFLDEYDLRFLKKHYSRSECDGGLVLEHFLNLKADRLIDWYLTKKEYSDKNKEMLVAKRKFLELEKESNYLKVLKENTFNNI